MEIDVIIPAYNSARFILGALNSVIAQTYQPKQIIVVDDGSTDTTSAIVSAYAKNCIIPILLIKKNNAGLSAARNTGIENSTSPFIAFLDADDMWEKTKLEKQIAVYSAKTFTNLGLVYCRYLLIDENNKPLSTTNIPPLDKELRGSVYTKLFANNTILSSGSGVLLRREVFEVVGKFDTTLKFGEDWDMWLRIAEKYNIDYVDTNLVYIRKHTGNMSGNPDAAFRGEIAFFNKWAPQMQHYGVLPNEWADRIAARILKRLPKTDFIFVVKKHLNKEIYTALFKNTSDSLFLYCIYFIFKKAFKRS